MFSDQFQYSQKSFGYNGCELTLKRSRFSFTDLLFCSFSTCILALIFKSAGAHLNVSWTWLPVFSLLNPKVYNLSLVRFCICRKEIKPPKSQKIKSGLISRTNINLIIAWFGHKFIIDVLLVLTVCRPMKFIPRQINSP